MRDKPNILIVIPARGGSKGVPRKNIRFLCGQPLISYVIKAALEIKYDLDVVVSTDDKEIAEVASSYGAQVPFIRPKSISGSNSTLVLVSKHALDYYAKNGKKYDAILSLQPTAPLVSPKTIENVIDKYINSKFTSIFTVSLMSQGHPYTAKRITSGEKIEDFVKIPKGAITFPRQKREEAFYTNGAIYLRNSKLVEGYESGGWQLGENPGCVVMGEHESIDINSNFDFIHAEAVIRYVKSNL